MKLPQELINLIAEYTPLYYIDKTYENNRIAIEILTGRRIKAGGYVPVHAHNGKAGYLCCIANKEETVNGKRSDGNLRFLISNYGYVPDY